MPTSCTTRRLLLGLAGIALVASACGSDSSADEPPGSLPQGGEPLELDPADFTTEIDSPYWPMEVGTRWTYRETDGEGGTFDVVVIVTDQTKRLANGIEARVVRDTVTTADGELVEDTFDYYAQDAEGNLWYLGEDTAEFEDGHVTSRAGSWEAGVDGAEPGIALLADPQPGDAYRQEYKEGEAEDRGEVLALDQMADTPSGHYDGLVLTADTTPVEPDVLEYKFYAEGVGPVMTLDVSGGSGREVLLGVDQAPAVAGTGPLGHPNA